MSRASFVPVALLCLVLPGRSLAQDRMKDTRFKSGNIVVKQSTQRIDEKGGPVGVRSHILLRDQIDFGRCFDHARYRRLAITYYHPHGPVGVAFQRFNWFRDPVNTYHSDARLPASLVGLCASSGSVNLPTAPLAALWSEPPVAVIGMNAATPAAYARPWQHFHFYEPSKEIIELNQRTKDRVFHFLPDARQRGAALRIAHGRPRQTLRERGPRRFYHLMILEACSGEDGEKIFLDLFTKEGIAQCMEHLVDDGILCVHVSHRFVDLPPVLAAIGHALKLHVRRGHDNAPGNVLGWGGRKVELAEVGHYTSEWVMLGRNREVILGLPDPPGYTEKMRIDNAERRRRGLGPLDDKFWTTPRALDHVWTDKGPNLLHGILRGHPFAMRYSAVAVPCTDAVIQVLRLAGLDSTETQHFIRDLAYLPRPVEDYLVEQQLKMNPQVEKLWR